MAAAKKCDCCKQFYEDLCAPAVLVKIDLHYQGELVPDLCPRWQQRVADLVGVKVFDVMSASKTLMSGHRKELRKERIKSSDRLQIPYMSCVR